MDEDTNCQKPDAHIAFQRDRDEPSMGRVPESYSTGCDKAIADPHARCVSEDTVDHLHVLFSQAGQRVVHLGHSLGHLLQNVDVLHFSSRMQAAYAGQLVCQNGCVERLQPAQAFSKSCRPANTTASSSSHPVALAVFTDHPWDKLSAARTCMPVRLYHVWGRDQILWSLCDCPQGWV